MSQFVYPFEFSEDASNPIAGSLELDEPLPTPQSPGGGGFFRPGRIKLHNPATAQFIYLRQHRMDTHLLEIIGMEKGEAGEGEPLTLPGQLCLGSMRSELISEAMRYIFSAKPLADVLSAHGQQNLAVFPIAREGLKYGVAEAVFTNAGYYCDEIVLDAHHVFDSSVPVYNRTVELTLFKDKDLDQHQKENITVAFLADSIASGLVMKEVIARVSERFENLQQVEVIAPLATIRGLCRIAQAETTDHLCVRVHVFETLLNALPPDYYYSAHFPQPEFHFDREAETAYRKWWGGDAAGNAIADTACAGYGWSEVFYSPRKQIQMMNSQLEARHGLTIAEIVRRNLRG
jgi:hypothetical protein